jgi:hypothetical protein
VRGLAPILLLVVLFTGRQGILRWVLGGTAGERSLYIKLPLEQPRFHWYFLDEAALLRGSLEIELHGAGGRDTLLTVFREGRFGSGWEPISRRRDRIYFGFVGGGHVWTQARDSLVVRLRVAEDLDGIGAYQGGVLREGVYEAVASYSHLTGHPSFRLFRRPEGPTAFVGCWRSTWKLDVTSDRGWMGAADEEQDQFSEGWMGQVMRYAFGEVGTDGFRCVK